MFDNETLVMYPILNNVDNDIVENVYESRFVFVHRLTVLPSKPTLARLIPEIAFHSG